MTLTIKLDRNWRSFQLANSAPPLSVTDSAIAPSSRMSRPLRHTQQPHQHTPEQVLVAVHAHARPTPPLGGGEHRALHSRGAPHRIIEWRAAARCAWPDGSAECCVCVCRAPQAGGAIRGRAGQDDCSWAEARIKIARMTLTIKLDRNWRSFHSANSTPPLSVTGSAIAPSARMLRNTFF